MDCSLQSSVPLVQVQRWNAFCEELVSIAELHDFGWKSLFFPVGVWLFTDRHPFFLGIGVPIMLAYVYGVVPISLCRGGGCGVSTANGKGVKIEFDEDDGPITGKEVAHCGHSLGGRVLGNKDGSTGQSGGVRAFLHNKFVKTSLFIIPPEKIFLNCANTLQYLFIYLIYVITHLTFMWP